MNSECLKLRHPFNLIVAGPTSSGKTTLTRDLLSHHLLTTTIKKSKIKVVWCFGQYQALYSKPIDNVEVIYNEGLITADQMEQIHADVIVIDDLMQEVASNEQMVNLFTKQSHHMNISVCFIIQNLFFQSRLMRTISLNAHYLILMRNPRDRLQVVNLGRQILPGQSAYFRSVFEDATRAPYSHLMIDLHPLCEEWSQFRYWNNVKGEKEFIVYKRK